MSLTRRLDRARFILGTKQSDEHAWRSIAWAVLGVLLGLVGIVIGILGPLPIFRAPAEGGTSAAANHRFMTSGWLMTWPVDNAMSFSIAVIVAITAIAVIFHWVLKERWAGLAVAILVPVAFTVVLNHVLAEHRDRVGRRWTLQQDHVRRLRLVMLADAEGLKEVAQRTEAQGAPLLSKVHNPASNRNEMEARFMPDPLSGDVKNHYITYAQDKTRLRRSVEDQDEQYATLTSRLVGLVPLPPTHPYHYHISRAFVSKCLGRGHGMTLRRDDSTYSYAWTDGGGGSGAGPAPRELLEAFQTVSAFRPEAALVSECMSMSARSAVIISEAKKLAADARMLAEQTTLIRDCEYTRLQ